MATTYKPPRMPAFPASLDELYRTIAPYYREQRPLDLFFEFFVVDVLGLLPHATQNAIDELTTKHPTFFASTNGDWRAGVRKMLNLSETIDIAILDLWYRNRQTASDQGWHYHPWHYAKNFREEYAAKGSRVDIWEGDALEQAKARINAERNRH
jgi:hypothetical protein